MPKKSRALPRAVKSNKLSVSVVSLLSCFGMLAICGMQTALAASSSSTKSSSTKIASLSKAQTNKPFSEFRLQPRFSVWGFTGDSTFTQGQFLAPFYGDATRALYVVTKGGIVKNDSSWDVGAGLGYRQIVNNKIFGGYTLLDYNSTPHNGFVIINPGLEMLGNVWDVRVNGYIPISNRKKLGDEGWALDDFGIEGYTYPTGHEYWDHRMQKYDEPTRGFDFDIARVVPHIEAAKLHLGAYHFDTSDAGSTNGVKARITYDLNRYVTLEVQDSYDNTKLNQFLVGIRFSLGGYSSEEKKQYGLATRLVDPIEYMDQKMVSYVSVIEDHGLQEEHDNVWYIRPGEDSANIQTQTHAGTAEDPFRGFDVSTYNIIHDGSSGEINTYPLLYFTKGSTAYNFSTGGWTDGIFDLPSGWGMYGKTAGYLAPATGGDRPEFDGGRIEITGTPDSSYATTLDSVKISSELPTASEASLLVNNANNVTLRNTDIRAMYGYGIKVAEGSTINFENYNDAIGGSNTVTTNSSAAIHADASTVNFNSGTNEISATGSAYGIDAVSHSIVNFGSTTSVSNTVTASNNAAIHADDSTVNFNSGTNIITASGDYGIHAVNHSIVNFGIFGAATGGSNTVTSTGASAIYSNDSTVNFNSQTNILNSSGSGLNGSHGIEAENTSNVYFKGGSNTINATAGGAYSYGISADSSRIYFTGGTNIINSSGGSAASCGLYANTNSEINLDGGTNYIYLNNGTMPTSGAAYGIYATGTSAVNFNYGTNIVDVKGPEDTAGLYAADGSLINFTNGTNTITSTATGGGAYGIYATGSSTVVTFTDGTNHITANGNNSSGTYETDGLYAADYSTITFAGGTDNRITATGTGDTRGLYAAKHNAINFNNGTNTITAASTNVHTGEVGRFSDGVLADDHSVITFRNGTNSISATNTTGWAAGITTPSGAGHYVTINFANSGNPAVSITATGDTSIGQYGIQTYDSTSILQAAGLTVTDASMLTNLVSFPIRSSTEQSKAISWLQSTGLVEESWPIAF